MTYRALLAIAVFFAVVTALAVFANRALPTVDALSVVDSVHPGAPRSALVGFQCFSAYAPDTNYCYRDGDGVLRATYATLDGATVRSVSLSFSGAQIAALDARYGHATSRSGSRHVVRLCYGGRARAVVILRPFGTLSVSTYLSLASDDASLC